MTLALIMAGGRSARMRATAGERHKALKSVLGVPLIERNICRLLGLGFRTLVVATSSRESAISQYVSSRGRDLVAAMDATIDCVIETHPLGTIGIVGRLAEKEQDILVINVDNLTDLDLLSFVKHHIDENAAMTVAVHNEYFQIPFGQVVIEEGEITNYLEKPKLPVPISSGTYVLAPRACRSVAQETRTDIPELLMNLRRSGEKVLAFEHDALWIDVNDAAALKRADTLVLENEDAFECWQSSPSASCIDLLVESNGSVLVEQRIGDNSRYPGQWDLPFNWLSSQCKSDESMVERMPNGLGTESLSPRRLTVFDNLDAATGKLIRHYVYHAHAPSEKVAKKLSDKNKWVAIDEVESQSDFSPALLRSLTMLRRSHCE